MRTKLQYFLYPQTGFAILMWVILSLWVSLSVGANWQLSSLVPKWEEYMAGERRELEQQIEVLQEHIKHNSGFSDDRGN